MQFLQADNEDWSECIDVQADLTFRWANMSEGTFSHAELHLFCKYEYIKADMYFTFPGI